MITIWANISNPWAKNSGEFVHDYFMKDIQLSENKSLEIQVSKSNFPSILTLDVDTHLTGEDHAGLRFNLELFGYFFSIQLYDHRHWNHDEERWQTAEDYKKEEKNMEKFTGSLEQNKKFNIYYNDNLHRMKENWYIATDNGKVIPLNEGDYISHDSNGNIKVIEGTHV